MQSVIAVVSDRESALSRAAELIARMKARGSIADWSPVDPGRLCVILKLDTSAQRLKEIVGELRALGCEVL